jgi:LAO/AO transport system kinase
VPVLATNALENEGVPELLDAVERHRVWLAESGQLEARRRARAAGRVRDVVERELRRVAWASDEVKVLLDTGVDEIARGDATPYSVAEGILRALLR